MTFPNSAGCLRQSFEDTLSICKNCTDLAPYVLDKERKGKGKGKNTPRSEKHESGEKHDNKGEKHHDKGEKHNNPRGAKKKHHGKHEKDGKDGKGKKNNP